jgi:hypothetical protein
MYNEHAYSTCSKAFSTHYPPHPLGRRIVVTLLLTLALLVIVLLALPVALLPLGTAVPAPLWVLLAVIDVGAIAAVF